MATRIESELGTPDEVAAELRVTRRDVLEAARRGELERVKLGKQVRITWASVANLRIHSKPPMHARGARPNQRPKERIS